MFNLFYNLVLALLLLLALPRMLFRYGKYRGTWLERLGCRFPKIAESSQPLVWVHAVSLGETRAVLPLIERFLKEGYSVAISSTTATGHAEALRSVPEAVAHFYLPFDFSWIMRGFMRRLQPQKLLLSESDFWYQLLAAAKEIGAKVVLVNGKVSERSARRFGQYRFFTRRLFAHFDHLCVQNEIYFQRWIAMGIPAEKMTITGNLKWDVTPSRMSLEAVGEWKQALGILEGDRVVVIGSSHADEELPLLKALSTLKDEMPNLKILWVPRHPERFKEVEAMLKVHGWGMRSYSTLKPLSAPIVLIDATGVLNQCYQIADVAIVAGSFTPLVGGHNILEPIMFGVPVLFGPHMHNQQELRELVLGGGAGAEVGLKGVASALKELLLQQELCQRMSHAGVALQERMRGAADRTYTKCSK